MKRRDLIRHLTVHDCVFVREGQSDTIYENSARNNMLSTEVHLHANNIADKPLSTLLDSLAVTQ